MAKSSDRIVLVVDDDQGVRQMLARALEFEGFVVVEAANGRDALTRLRSGRKPGIIVLDLRMPIMDGWAFRVAQQKDARIAGIPVIVLSGADTHRFRELDAVATFEKPVAISLLTDHLRNFFDGA